MAEPTHSINATGLADILERLLDKGIVIAGDIKIQIADIDLLTIRSGCLWLRLTKPWKWASTGGRKIPTSRQKPGKRVDAASGYPGGTAGKLEAIIFHPNRQMR